jgi:hypothetical protein
MEKPGYIQKVWEKTRWFLRLFPFWIVLIFAINVWQQRQEPANLAHEIQAAIGMVLASITLYGFFYLIYTPLLAWTGHESRSK